MKKFIYLLTILIVVMFSICACDNNQEQLNNNSENQNSQVTNQEENQNNTDNELTLNSGENVKETMNEKVKESGNQGVDVVEIIEEKESSEQNEQSQSISVSATALSNKINAWGFVRQKNEVRPQFSAAYTKVLDDYEGIYAGNPDEKVIYLTFDEGYENGYTASILDTLKEKDCPATFFVTKPYVKQNQELVKRMIDEGHIVR